MGGEICELEKMLKVYNRLTQFKYFRRMSFWNKLQLLSKTASNN